MTAKPQGSSFAYCHDPATVERQDRQQVEKHEHQIHANPGERHQPHGHFEERRQQWREVIKHRPAQGHDEVRTRAGGRDPGHVLPRLSQGGKIHRHRLRPTEEKRTDAGKRAQYQDHARHQDGSDQVDVPQRIEADTALRVRGAIAEVARHVTVRRFVQRDREQYRKSVNRDRLYERADVH